MRETAFITSVEVQLGVQEDILRAIPPQLCPALQATMAFDCRDLFR
jgi:hypothetical protein